MPLAKNVEKDGFAQKTIKFIKDNKILFSLLTFLGISSIGVGTAYQFGAFGPKTQPKQKNGVKLKVVDIQVPSSGLIKDCSSEVVETLLRADKKDVPSNLHELYTQAREQKYAQSLMKDQDLKQPGTCAAISALQEKQNNYNLTEAQKEILRVLVDRCQKEQPITQPLAPITNNGGTQIQAENTPVEPPTTGDGDVPSPPHQENPEGGGGSDGSGGGGGTDDETPIPEDSYKPIKEFLAAESPTLTKLLGTPEALAKFKLLNMETPENRKTALGNNENLVNAFDNLLDAHIFKFHGKEHTGDTDLDTATKNLLTTARDNATNLGLEPSKLAEINRILDLKSRLVRASEMLDDILDSKKSGTPASRLAALSPADIADLRVASLDKLQCQVSKRVSEKEKPQFVRTNQFIEFYNSQHEYAQLFPDIKLPTTKMNQLNTACNAKLTAAGPAIQAAVQGWKESAALYRNVYELYTKASKSEEVGRKIIEAVCLKAVYEQADAPASTTFPANSYRALCLAVDAHIQLRGQLAEAGKVAGVPEIENTTVPGFREDKFDLNKWPEDKMKAFVAAIETAHMKTNASVQAAADLTKYIRNHETFLRELETFLSVLNFFYTNKEDMAVPNYQKEQMERAQTACTQWDEKITALKTAVTVAKTFDQFPQFIAAALKLDMVFVLGKLSGIDDPTDYPKFKAVIEDMKKRKLSEFPDDTSFEYKIKAGEYDCIIAFVEFNAAIFDEPENVKNLFLHPTTGLFKIVHNKNGVLSMLEKVVSHEFKINHGPEIVEKITNVLQDSEKLRNAVMIIKASLDLHLEALKAREINDLQGTLFQDYIVANVTIIKKFKQYTELLDSMVKRAVLFKVLDTSHANYVIKMNTAKEEALATLNHLSVSDKKYFNETFENITSTEPSKVFPFLATNLDVLGKQTFAKLYALLLIFHESPTVNPAVLAEAQDEDRLTNFVTNCVAYCEAAFKVYYINSSRDERGFVKCSLIPFTNRWNHKKIEFSLISRIVDNIDSEMNTYAGANCNIPSFVVNEQAVVTYPLSAAMDVVEHNQDNFMSVQKGLVQWALRNYFHKSP